MTEDKANSSFKHVSSKNYGTKLFTIADEILSEIIKNKIS